MILVDTSAWIDFFRGRGRLAAEVDALLEDNDVALCGPVIAELRRGIRSRKERETVLGCMGGCRLLPQPQDLWDQAGELGVVVARAGTAVKTMDLLIATYALAHDLPLLTRDGDFALIREAGVPLALM